MPPPRSLPLSHRPGRWLAALLVFAVLGLQTLGQAHRVLHPQTGAHADAHGHEHSHGHAHGAVGVLPEATADHDEAGNGWSPLFGHERQADACELFDQLSLGDLAFAAAEFVTRPPPSGAAGFWPGMSPNGAFRRAYQARGPPPIVA